jgi:hypothetical protein
VWKRRSCPSCDAETGELFINFRARELLRSSLDISLFANSSHIGERVAGSIESGGEQTSRRTRPYVSIAAWRSVYFDELERAAQSHRSKGHPASHFIACLAMAHRLTQTHNKYTFDAR